jgi:two-component system, NarL family, sensor histidine kinase UhpB
MTPAATTRLYRAFLCTLALSLMLQPGTVAADCAPHIASVMAARDSGQGRPVDGWQPVTLPDDWSLRWPGHDGSVWYRLQLQRPCAGTAPASALVIHYLIMAGEVFINDSLLWRDRHLTEPLSRSWNSPRYWVLPETTGAKAEDIVWVRVAGVAAQTPGLGRVSVGHQDAMLALYQRELWRTRTLSVINLTVSAVLGTLALFVWLAFPAHRMFGYYALTSICWVLFGLNTLATEAWPFPSTEAVARANHLAYILFIASFCVFTWRLLALRHPDWLEKGLGMLGLAALGMILLVPGWAPLHLAGHLGTLILLLNILYVIGQALRRRQPEDYVVAVTFLLLITIAVRDLLVLAGMLKSDYVLTPYTCLLFMLMAAVLLGVRVARSARRIERFNQELSDAVDQACTDLSRTLEKEHQLAINNSRLQERLQLAHDLHDGLGGQIVRSIMVIEQRDTPLQNDRFLSMLKLLRDDLRQVIDSGASATAAAPATPAEWAAPLRYRFANLCDALGISLAWQVPEAWQTPPNALQCLLLARLAEEALTNAVKHSQAHQARVTLQQHEHALVLRVEDDGIGFDVEALQGASLGIGLDSMRARAERMGGTLTLHSCPGATVLEARLPLQDR